MKIEQFTQITELENSYELLDSGDGMKLERYGAFTLARPDPQALWKKKLEQKKWLDADALFTNNWKARSGMPASWEITYNSLTFEVRMSAFKHTGIFPEHSPNWNFMREVIEKAKKAEPNRQVNILNLFGYTGGATLACLQAGANVVHDDASKPSVDAAAKNATLSGLSEKPVRWIVDDAVAFVKRELRRGNLYDGIVLDPPAFGRGPKGEVWKIEQGLLPLLEEIMQIMSKKPIFLILNGYAAGYAPEAYLQALQSVMLGPKVRLSEMKETIQYGNLLIQESGKDGRVLPAGVYARVVY